MTFLEIVGTIAQYGPGLLAIFIVLSGIVQISPIKINPWSSLCKAIGKALNADVLKEIETMKAHQKQIQSKLEQHIKTDDERDADMRRQRILRFNHDVMRGLNFTEEYFSDMLREIDTYEIYCETHKEYKNSKAVMAISNIKRVCEDHERNNDFAT